MKLVASASARHHLDTSPLQPIVIQNGGSFYLQFRVEAIRRAPIWQYTKSMSPWATTRSLIFQMHPVAAGNKSLLLLPYKHALEKALWLPETATKRLISLRRRCEKYWSYSRSWQRYILRLSFNARPGTYPPKTFRSFPSIHCHIVMMLILTSVNTTCSLSSSLASIILWSWIPTLEEEEDVEGDNE